MTDKKHHFIHISDLSVYCRCRRQWDWSSPLRMGLQPGVKGIALSLGGAYHEAQKAGYANCLGGDMHFEYEPAATKFLEWIDERRATIEEYTGAIWESDLEELEKVKTLGLSMLKHYELWASQYDAKLECHELEQWFQIQIPETDLWYAGRRDGLVRSKKNGKYYILEHKTARSVKEKSLAGVFRGLQPILYSWALQKTRPDIDLGGVLYRVAWKRAPDYPKYLQSSGTFSVAKRIKTSLEWTQYVLEEYWAEKLGGMPEALSAASGLIARLMGTDNQFFKQVIMRKTPQQMKGAVQALQVIGSEMMDPDVEIFPINGFHCSWCNYKVPCDLVSRGYEDEAMAVLAAEYERREFWEGPWEGDLEE